MVFRPDSTTQTGTAPRLAADSSCLVCRSGLRKLPGNIAVFEQQLSFTQRQAINVLAEVLTTKVGALTRSRWMCATCYAQLELLDKYERDRRQLEQKATTIQTELVGTFRRSTVAAVPQPASSPAPDDGRPQSPQPKRRRRSAEQSDAVCNNTDANAEASANAKADAKTNAEASTNAEAAAEASAAEASTEASNEAEAADSRPAAAEDADLRNGNDSDIESDYVEINVASIAAGAATPFREPSENGEDPKAGAGVGEDTESAEEEEEEDQELDPLADARVVDVKQEMVGSDGEDVDMHEDVPAMDPLADGLDGDHQPDDVTAPDDDVTGTDDDATDPNRPVVNLTALQNTLRTRLRGSSPPRVGKRPLSDTGDAPLAAKPVQVSVCVVQPRSAGLKALLPKPGPGQPSPKPPAPPLSPVPASKPSAPVSKVPPPAPSPPVSATAPAAGANSTGTSNSSQLPVFLQGVDGKLYMLPGGAQAVAGAGGAGNPPVTLLRLPDGRLVMPGSGGGTVKTATVTQAPILPTVNPPAPSTLKNLLLGGEGVMMGKTKKKKQRMNGRNFVMIPTSEILPDRPRPRRGPILESILQRSGSEPCPLCSLIFSSAAEVDHHLRNHSMVCSGCDHLFASRVSLFEHRQTCVPSRPPRLPTPPPLGSSRSRSALVCNQCPATAPDTAALNEHAAQAHSLLYRCPKCDCRTAELLQFAHHVRSAHAMEVPHPCNLCQTSFLRSEQREIHVRERHGPPQLGDRPLVKDRTIDGVRLPAEALLEKRKTPTPPPPEVDGEKEREDGKEGADPLELGSGEEEESGMLIVKEETSVDETDPLLL